MPAIRTKLSERLSSRDSKPKTLRDLRAELIALLSRWRDDPSCPKKASAIFDTLVDTVDAVPRKLLRIYLLYARVFSGSSEEIDVVSQAANETLASIRNGAFRPNDAARYVEKVIRLFLKKISVAEMYLIKIGRQDLLQEFVKRIENDRASAFEGLEEASLVICHTKLDGAIGLEWPDPAHPAAAAYLATMGRPLILLLNRPSSPASSARDAVETKPGKGAL
jgi:hypothetical protein